MFSFLGFPLKNSICFSLLLMRGTLHAHMIFIGFIARTIFDVEQRP